MLTTYGIFKREIYSELKGRYDDCEYSSAEKLNQDIYFDSEEILESCVKESLTDIGEDEVGQLAYSYLKEAGATMEALFEVIRNPEKILYYAYCAVFDETVETFVENFDYIEDWD